MMLDIALDRDMAGSQEQQLERSIVVGQVASRLRGCGHPRGLDL